MSNKLTDQEFYATLPRKRIVGAVLVEHDQRILIVKPTYKDFWLIPGGVIEKHESPYTGALREFHEEIGFTTEIVRLLCVDHVNQETPFADEAIHFLFRGRDLRSEEIARIRLQESELSEYRLVDFDEAERLLDPRLARRLAQAINDAHESPLYLENGENRMACK